MARFNNLNGHKNVLIVSILLFLALIAVFRGQPPGNLVNLCGLKMEQFLGQWKLDIASLKGAIPYITAFRKAKFSGNGIKNTYDERLHRKPLLPFANLVCQNTCIFKQGVYEAAISDPVYIEVTFRSTKERPEYIFAKKVRFSMVHKEVFTLNRWHRTMHFNTYMEAFNEVDRDGLLLTVTRISDGKVDFTLESVRWIDGPYMYFESVLGEAHVSGRLVSMDNERYLDMDQSSMGSPRSHVSYSIVPRTEQDDHSIYSTPVVTRRTRSPSASGASYEHDTESVHSHRGPPDRQPDRQLIADLKDLQKRVRLLEDYVFARKSPSSVWFEDDESRHSKVSSAPTSSVPWKPKSESEASEGPKNKQGTKRKSMSNKPRSHSRSHDLEQDLDDRPRKSHSLKPGSLKPDYNSDHSLKRSPSGRSGSSIGDGSKKKSMERRSTKSLSPTKPSKSSYAPSDRTSGPLSEIDSSVQTKPSKSSHAASDGTIIPLSQVDSSVHVFSGPDRKISDYSKAATAYHRANERHVLHYGTIALDDEGRMVLSSSSTSNNNNTSPAKSTISDLQRKSIRDQSTVSDLQRKSRDQSTLSDEQRKSFSEQLSEEDHKLVLSSSGSSYNDDTYHTETPSILESSESATVTNLARKGTEGDRIEGDLGKKKSSKSQHEGSIKRVSIKDQSSLSDLQSNSIRNQSTVSDLPRKSTRSLSSASDVQRKSIKDQSTLSDSPRKSIKNQSTESDLPRRSTKDQANVSVSESFTLRDPSTVSDLPRKSIRRISTLSDLPRKSIRSKSTVSDLPRKSVRSLSTISYLPRKSIKDQLTVSDLPRKSIRSLSTVSDLPSKSTKDQPNVSDSKSTTIRDPSTVSDLPRKSIKNLSTVSDLPRESIRDQSNASDLQSNSIRNQSTISDLPRKSIKNRPTLSDLPRRSTKDQSNVSDSKSNSVRDQSTVSDLPRKSIRDQSTASDLQSNSMRNQSTVSVLPRKITKELSTVSDFPRKSINDPSSVSDLQSYGIRNKSTVSDLPRKRTRAQSNVSDSKSTSIRDQSTVSDLPRKSIKDQSTVSDLQNYSFRDPSSLSDSQIRSVKDLTDAKYDLNKKIGSKGRMSGSIPPTSSPKLPKAEEENKYYTYAMRKSLPHLFFYPSNPSITKSLIEFYQHRNRTALNYDEMEYDEDHKLVLSSSESFYDDDTESSSELERSESSTLTNSPTIRSKEEDIEGDLKQKKSSKSQNKGSIAPTNSPKIYRRSKKEKELKKRKLFHDPSKASITRSQIEFYQNRDRADEDGDNRLVLTSSSDYNQSNTSPNKSSDKLETTDNSSVIIFPRKQSEAPDIGRGLESKKDQPKSTKNISPTKSSKIFKDDEKKNQDREIPYPLHYSSNPTITTSQIELYKRRETFLLDFFTSQFEKHNRMEKQEAEAKTDQEPRAQSLPHLFLYPSNPSITKSQIKLYQNRDRTALRYSQIEYDEDHIWVPSSSSTSSNYDISQKESFSMLDRSESSTKTILPTKKSEEDEIKRNFKKIKTRKRQKSGSIPPTNSPKINRKETEEEQVLRKESMKNLFLHPSDPSLTRSQIEFYQNRQRAALQYDDIEYDEDNRLALSSSSGYDQGSTSSMKSFET